MLPSVLRAACACVAVSFFESSGRASSLPTAPCSSAALCPDQGSFLGRCLGLPAEAVHVSCLGPGAQAPRLESKTFPLALDDNFVVPVVSCIVIQSTVDHLVDTGGLFT